MAGTNERSDMVSISTSLLDSSVLNPMMRRAALIARCAASSSSVVMLIAMRDIDWSNRVGGLGLTDMFQSFLRTPSFPSMHAKFCIDINSCQTALKRYSKEGEASPHDSTHQRNISSSQIQNLIKYQ